jgi:hypothetical protein
VDRTKRPSANPFDLPPIVSGPVDTTPTPAWQVKPLPEGRPLRIPVFDDGEREAAASPPNAKA